jgi:putative transposase
VSGGRVRRAMTSPMQVRKTCKYKLSPTPTPTPTPAQEQALEFVVRRCRERYHAALQERRDAWQQCGVSVTFAMQSAHLPGVKAVRPDDQDSNAHVLQEVLHRLDTAFPACFRRVAAGGGG